MRAAYYNEGVLLLLPLIAIIISTAAACTTPAGTKGSCVPLKQCSNLYAISRLKKEAADLLKSAECDFGPAAPAAAAGKGVCCQPERIFELPDNCGVAVYDRIANGNKTAVFEFPWLALLMARDKLSEELTSHCGGSLITDRYVLTAAHCLVANAESDLAFVRLGEHTISTKEDCNNFTDSNGVTELDCADPVEDVPIESVVIHPQYRKSFGGNDIGLIRLAKKITFKDHIRPICLPLSAELKDVLLSEYYVAGWGLTEDFQKSDVLLKAQLRRMESTDCQQKIDSVPKRRKIVLSAKQICAGGEKLVDTCQGDSGGPLMWLSTYNNRSRYIQFGVVSFGIESCGVIDFPGIYARVGSYLGWILTSMKA